MWRRRGMPIAVPQRHSVYAPSDPPGSPSRSRAQQHQCPSATTRWVLWWVVVVASQPAPVVAARTAAATATVTRRMRAFMVLLPCGRRGLPKGVKYSHIRSSKVLPARGGSPTLEGFGGSRHGGASRDPRRREDGRGPALRPAPGRAPGGRSAVHRAAPRPHEDAGGAL